jgi:ABC-2 type transport system permease protein
VPQRGSLVGDTLRAHRVGALAWILGGGLAMLGTAAALAAEMADFPGGAAALAASVSAGAEAMRLLRWPAERLDTLGGYLTYHNVILFNLFLALYGVVQGARDIRGTEERGGLEEILATGHPRAAVVRDRAITVSSGGQTHHFCSEKCRDEWARR